MKAYRFEPREETKWQWGFWGLYGFSWLVTTIIGVILDKPLISWIGLAICILMVLIISVDFVGYKIRRKKQ